MGSYVGIDLHRRRSVVVVLNEDGDRVSWCRIDNTAANLAAEIVSAGGSEAEVAMEACWGWCWAADVIAECGARLHLAHPLGIAGYENRRVKNDIRDATLLADLLRLGRLPEAWVAPPEVRELREAVRYRAKLSRLRSGLKQQVHQTLGKEGVIPEVDSIWRGGGQRWLDELQLGDVYVDRIESLRDLIELYDREIGQCDARIHRRLKGHPGYEAIQALRGVGPVLAAVFVAEIGDVGRFDNPRRLCSWAGLTPRLRESDAHSHRGHITKMECGGAGLARRFCLSFGGDCDDRWRYRHPSGPADLRLCRSGHGRGPRRAGDAGAPRPVARLVGAVPRGR